jgi:hypothetical protein
VEAGGQRQLFEKFRAYILRRMKYRTYQDAMWLKRIENNMRLKTKASQAHQYFGDFGPYQWKIREQAERPLQTRVVRLGLVLPETL